MLVATGGVIYILGGNYLTGTKEGHYARATSARKRPVTAPAAYGGRGCGLSAMQTVMSSIPAELASRPSSDRSRKGRIRGRSFRKDEPRWTKGAV